jgi:hypothetical protein
MHYVILITHQSDIKICTTNFSDLPVNDKSHYSHSNRCSFSQHVCAMRRSLITFRFFKTSVEYGSAYNNVLLHIKKATRLPEWLEAAPTYAHFAKTERKKKLFKSRRS